MGIALKWVESTKQQKAQRSCWYFSRVGRMGRGAEEDSQEAVFHLGCQERA